MVDDMPVESESLAVTSSISRIYLLSLLEMLIEVSVRVLIFAGVSVRACVSVCFFAVLKKEK
jgi:hypothetical protein